MLVQQTYNSLIKDPPFPSSELELGAAPVSPLGVPLDLVVRLHPEPLWQLLGVVCERDAMRCDAMRRR